MAKDSRSKTEILGILVTIVIGLIGFYGQIVSPEAGFVFFSLLLISILVYYIISYPIDLFKKRMSQVDKNTEELKQIREEINNIKKEFDIYEKISNINTRLAVLEERRKR